MMMRAVRCVSLLLVGVVATCRSQVTVGWESSDFTVREDAGGAVLCAEVKSSSVTTFSHKIRIVYEERNAGEGGDYIATPVNFTLTNAAPSFCFSVPIVDDTVFELTENFFVNLTTMGSGVILNPQLLIATIEDDDEVTIRSERTEITVREEEGSVEVCGILDGTLGVSLPRLNFLVVPGTATENMDYIIGRTRILTFQVGLPLRQCFTYPIVVDIAFEGDEMFQVILRTDNVLPLRVTLTNVTTNVTLLDYNVITVQQPVNANDSFAYLLSNATIPKNTICSQFQFGIECESPRERLQLTLTCNGTLSVVITDINSGQVEVNQTLMSSPQLQQVGFMIGGKQQNLTIRAQAVQYNGDYLILSLHNPSTGLQFKETAIVDCILPPTTTQNIIASTVTERITASSDSSTSSASSTSERPESTVTVTEQSSTLPPSAALPDSMADTSKAHSMFGIWSWIIVISSLLKAAVTI